MRILMRKNRWAFYIRLSREDGDRAESLSVVHQKLKLSEYAKTHPELTPYSWYIDDGYTGTNYDRPAFLRLLQDIEAGHICGVLVKDLSRLGRNNVKTSHYVHEYFPGHKVRFIAIDDAVDKDFFDIDTSKDMMIDLKNMFNGFYPRDISAKVRSTFRAKQCAGQFIGAFAAYGYRKSPSNHNKLLIDEPAAAIVRRIFCEYLSGIGASQIAKRLNEEQIPCPSLYKQMHEMAYHNANVRPGNGWTYSSVRNILRNPVYTGNMVQNRSFRQVCSKKALPLPPEQWITVEATHPAIVSSELFDRVNTLLSHAPRQPQKRYVHLFTGLLHCADCGGSMVRICRNGTVRFRCGTYNRLGLRGCTSHSVCETALTNAVRNDLEAHGIPLPAESSLNRALVCSVIRQITIHEDGSADISYLN